MRDIKKGVLLNSGTPVFPNSEWGYESYAVFTASQYLTINKTQTITSEYTQQISLKLTPRTPKSIEALYGHSSGNFFIYLDTSNYINFSGNGAGGTRTPLYVSDTEPNVVSLSMKIGGVKIVVNGEVYEAAIDWDNTSWSEYKVGSSGGGGLRYSGTMSYFKDLDETWNFRDESLIGSLGTIPSEVGVITFEDAGLSAPVGAVVNEPIEYYSTFDSNGWVDFPSQFDIADNEPFYLAWRGSMDSVTFQSFLGDNETSNDRIRSEDGGSNLTVIFNDGNSLNFGTGGLQNMPNVLFELIMDDSRNLEVKVNGVSKGIKTSSNSAISFDNFGMGFNTSAANRFSGVYESLLIKRGVTLTTILNLVVRESDLIDTITNTIIAPSGTGTTFTSNGGGGGLKQSNYLFRNDGVDYIDCGRPSNIIDKLIPSVSEFTIVFTSSANNDGTFLSLGAGLNTGEKQLHIYTGYNQSQILLIIGGALNSVEFDTNGGELHEYVLSVTTTDGALYVDGNLLGTFTGVGSYSNTPNLYIGARTDGLGYNIEGDTVQVSFYEGASVDGTIDGLSLIDQYDLTNPSLWDGGPIGESVNGEVFSLTDGIPTTAHSIDLIPVSDLPYTLRAGSYSRNSAIFNTAGEQIDTGVKLGDDFDIEVINFRRNDGNTWVFSQYLSGDAGRFRMELLDSNGKMSIQVGWTIKLYDYVIEPAALIKSMRVVKVGEDITLTIDGVSQTIGGFLPVTQATGLVLGWTQGGQAGNFDCTGMKIDGEVWDFIDPSNQQIGSEGTLAQVVNASANFWERRMLPIGE